MRKSLVSCRISWSPQHTSWHPVFSWLLSIAGSKWAKLVCTSKAVCKETSLGMDSLLLSFILQNNRWIILFSFLSKFLFKIKMKSFFVYTAKGKKNTKMVKYRFLYSALLTKFQICHKASWGRHMCSSDFRPEVTLEELSECTGCKEHKRDSSCLWIRDRQHCWWVAWKQVKGDLSKKHHYHLIIKILTFN